MRRPLAAGIIACRSPSSYVLSGSCVDTGGGPHQTNQQETIRLAKVESRASKTDRCIGIPSRWKAYVAWCGQTRQRVADRGLAAGMGRGFGRSSIVRALSTGAGSHTIAHMIAHGRPSDAPTSESLSMGGGSVFLFPPIIPKSPGEAGLAPLTATGEENSEFCVRS